MAGKKLSKKDITYFQELLFALRMKIAGDLGNLGKDFLRKSTKDAAGDLSSTSFHMADMASDLYEVDFNLGLMSNEQNLLSEIDEALKRIEEGTYGVCEKYGTPIPKERLKVMPYTRYSLRAQEEDEEGK